MELSSKAGTPPATTAKPQTKEEAQKNQQHLLIKKQKIHGATGPVNKGKIQEWIYKNYNNKSPFISWRNIKLPAEHRN